ncbi:Protein ATP6V1FNB like protein [Argiope bruennichi]|uniref:Protein ATP6V1FNB like protein n=1 Tax=Argiope bruennichi TaxID=94029 RepID=A0A8T0EWT1_ARGBR|nr:Protein ATP6V1FNB like protein [Argiope bruennichi]
MAREKVLDPAFQKAFTETINKENKVTAHTSLDYTRGMMSSDEFLMVSDVEFVSELESQKVIAARRITLKRIGNIIPTSHVRVQWHLEHGPRLKRAAPDACKFDDDPDDDDDDFVPPDTDTSIEPERPEKELFLSWKKEEEYPEEEDAGKMIKIEGLKVMKPVPTDIKKLLYKGFSKEGEGRQKYLKERYLEDPEDKYFFPICTSWDYGWTFGEDYELTSPEFGNVEIMKTSFFRPNDPQLKPRDPID